MSEQGIKILDGKYSAYLPDEEALKEFKKDFPGFQNGLVRIEPGGWHYPAGYVKFADKIRKFKVSKVKL